jgi:multiple sugar transport system permease protein
MRPQGIRLSWLGFAKLALLLLAAAFAVLPILWGLSTALKTPQEIAQIPPTWIPRHITFVNFRRGVFTARFGQYLLNTLSVI